LAYSFVDKCCGVVTLAYYMYGSKCGILHGEGFPAGKVMGVLCLSSFIPDAGFFVNGRVSGMAE
jgi:hypothetical protein